VSTPTRLHGRTARSLATLAVTAACLAYIVWKIDVRRTIEVLGDAQAGYVVAAVAIMAAVTLPMAWRWKLLLRARGVTDRLGWLTRTYFVSYSAGQILPTSLGGDASRIYEGSRRHPEHRGAIAGSVVLERLLGGIATLALAAVGFLLAIGEYDVGAYLWIEFAFVLVAGLACVVFFSRSIRRPLAWAVPLLRKLRIERPIRTVYESIHAYRGSVRLLLGVFALTVALAAVRVLAIWLSGKAVGVELSPRPYYVMGPLLFLVMLVPFTVNGLAIREAFFVSFLGKLGVDPDAAFATGFLFFVVSLLCALPGALIVAWESFARRGRAADASTGSPP
jgi:uncharacterized protein (TIRG00374 family)